MKEGFWIETKDNQGIQREILVCDGLIYVHSPKAPNPSMFIVCPHCGQEMIIGEKKKLWYYSEIKFDNPTLRSTDFALLEWCSHCQEIYGIGAIWFYEYKFERLTYSQIKQRFTLEKIKP